MGDHNKKTTVDVKKAEKEKEAVESQFAVLKKDKMISKIGRVLRLNMFGVLMRMSIEEKRRKKAGRRLPHAEDVFDVDVSWGWYMVAPFRVHVAVSNRRARSAALRRNRTQRPAP